MSSDEDPGRKRRRTKAARPRRTPAPRAGADDRTAPPAAPPPRSAETGAADVERPPLPVRKPARGTTPTSGNTRNDASDSPAALPSPSPPLSLLSAEELLAEQPSIDMLRRVRRGLRALPDSDQRHLSE